MMKQEIEAKIVALKEEIAKFTKEIEARQLYILKAEGAIEAMTQLITNNKEDNNATETNSDSGRQESVQNSDS